MNNSLDDVLQRYFDDVARHDRLGDTPVRVVMRRGRRRRARRRTGAMAGTLVVGALGSVAAVRTLSSGDGERRVSVGTDGSDGSDDGPSPVPTLGPTAFAPSPLVWNDVTIGSTEAVSVGGPGVIGDAENGFYALSTAAGRSVETTPVLYRSGDGLSWEASGSPPPTDNQWTFDVTAGSGRIYAVSTQPAAAPVADTFDPGELTLTSSSDSGITWNDTPLPVDLASIRALPGVKSVRTSASIAVGPSSTLVAAVTNAELDVLALTPEGVDPGDLDWFSQPDGPVRYEHVQFDCSSAVTAPATVPPPGVETTVSISSTGQCSTRGEELHRYTWADLGVGAETARAHQGMLHLVRSDDGGATFTSLSAPALPDGWTASAVEAIPTNEGFALFVRLERFNGSNSQESMTAAYLSPDGVQWQATNVPGMTVASAGVLADGTLAAVGFDGVGKATAVYRDGAWHVAPVPSMDAAGGPIMLDGPTFEAIGPLGIALVGVSADPAGESSAGGWALTPGVSESVPTSTMPIGGDASRATAPESTTSIVEEGAASTLAPQVAIIEDTSPASIEAVQMTGSGVAYDPATRRHVLLFSRDGVTWSLVDLSQLPDAPVALDTVRGVSVTADRLAIGTSEWTTGDVTSDTPLPDQRVLLGTLG